MYLLIRGKKGPKVRIYKLLRYPITTAALISFNIESNFVASSRTGKTPSELSAITETTKRRRKLENAVEESAEVLRSRSGNSDIFQMLVMHVQTDREERRWEREEREVQRREERAEREERDRKERAEREERYRIEREEREERDRRERADREERERKHSELLMALLNRK